MKREIKFRAWDKKKKKYFYPNDFDDRMVLQLNGVLGLQNEDKSYNTVTDGFILEQYTGLKDDKGVEIYEGDIVCWRGASGVEDGCGAVRYEMSCSQLVVDLIDNDDYEFFENISYANIALIGNVHEKERK